MTRECAVTDLGTEIRCTRCGEFWPADEEFFYRHAGGWHSYCKACYLSHPCITARRAKPLPPRGSSGASWLQAAMHFVVQAGEVDA